ncbi:hypothetical protein GJ496_008527 [Pomphorhynchus laevis]|nr:hypothetical protein GJ496_008527 [Pomphorhynchus laevis]
MLLNLAIFTMLLIQYLILIVASVLPLQHVGNDAVGNESGQTDSPMGSVNGVNYFDNISKTKMDSKISNLYHKYVDDNLSNAKELNLKIRKSDNSCTGNIVITYNTDKFVLLLHSTLENIDVSDNTLSAIIQNPFRVHQPDARGGNGVTVAAVNQSVTKSSFNQTDEQISHKHSINSSSSLLQNQTNSSILNNSSINGQAKGKVSLTILSDHDSDEYGENESQSNVKDFQKTTSSMDSNEDSNSYSEESNGEDDQREYTTTLEPLFDNYFSYTPLW